MTPEDMKWFRVEITDHEGQIVSIEPEMLAGRDIGEVEEAKIREAIEHLQGFVGPSAGMCMDCGCPDHRYCTCQL